MKLKERELIAKQITRLLEGVDDATVYHDEDGTQVQMGGCEFDFDSDGNLTETTVQI